MSEPVFIPEYWRDRLESAPTDEMHHSIFLCRRDVWKGITEQHKKTLARLIGPGDSVLDAGCAYGRLLTLLPRNWAGRYLGVDLSPDFIKLARRGHPLAQFAVCDLRRLNDVVIRDRFDWAVLISIKLMVIKNYGTEAWGEIEEQLKRVCRQILILEYEEPEDFELIQGNHVWQA